MLSLVVASVGNRSNVERANDELSRFYPLALNDQLSGFYPLAVAACRGNQILGLTPSYSAPS